MGLGRVDGRVVKSSVDSTITYLLFHWHWHNQLHRYHSIHMSTQRVHAYSSSSTIVAAVALCVLVLCVVLVSVDSTCIGHNRGIRITEYTVEDVHPSCTGCTGHTEGFSTTTTPHTVVVLAISTPTTDAHALPPHTRIRYQDEKDFWLTRYPTPDWMRCVLIECAACDNDDGCHTNKEEDRGTAPVTIQQYPCVESFQPGIFQKSLLAIQDMLHRTTASFFVRTNLSTCVLPSRLQAYVQQHAPPTPDIPFYSGVYCHQEKWVGGFGVILNRTAATMLVHEGMRQPWFDQPDVADDVQMGRVMQHMGVACNPESPLLFYTWDTDHDTAHHLEHIRTHPHVVFVRLKLEASEGDSRRAVYAEATVALVDRWIASV